MLRVEAKGPAVVDEGGLQAAGAAIGVGEEVEGVGVLPLRPRGPLQIFHRERPVAVLQRLLAAGEVEAVRRGSRTVVLRVAGREPARRGQGGAKHGQQQERGERGLHPGFRRPQWGCW